MRRSIPSLNVISQVDLLQVSNPDFLLAVNFACVGLAVVHWEKPNRKTRRILGHLQIYSSGLCRDSYFHHLQRVFTRLPGPQEIVLAKRPGTDPDRKQACKSGSNVVKMTKKSLQSGQIGQDKKCRGVTVVNASVKFKSRVS